LLLSYETLADGLLQGIILFKLEQALLTVAVQAYKPIYSMIHSVL